MLRITKLNGWQRLWIVLSLVLLPVVATLTYANFPSQEAMIYVMLKEEQTSVDLFEEFALRNLLLEGKPVIESEREFSAKESGKTIKLDTARLEQIASRIRVGHAKDVAKVVLLGVVVWVAVCMLLYGMGWSVDWIVEGFRKGKP